MATPSSRWTRSMLEFIVLPVAFFAAFGNAAYDPINQMCSRWNHQSIVKNNILFIDGTNITLFPQEVLDPRC
jgi:hypothetical protein